MKYVKKGQASKCFTRISTNSAHPNVVTLQKKTSWGDPETRIISKKQLANILTLKIKISRQWHIQISSCITPNPPIKTVNHFATSKPQNPQKDNDQNMATTATSWFLSWPCYSPSWKSLFTGDFGYLTIPKRSQRIARPSCCHWLVSFRKKKS